MEEILARIRLAMRKGIRYPVSLVVPFIKHRHATQGTATYNVAICYR
jgi:hypothetical protein